MYDDERGRAGLDGVAGNSEETSALSAHQQYLGDVGEGLPDGPVIELNEALPEGVKKEQIIIFGNYYRSHSEVDTSFSVWLKTTHSTYNDNISIGGSTSLMTIRGDENSLNIAPFFLF